MIDAIDARSETATGVRPMRQNPSAGGAYRVRIDTDTGDLVIRESSSQKRKLSYKFTETVVLAGAAGATAANYGCFWTAPFACKLISCVERHSTAGNDAGAVTIMLKKVPSGTAVGSGTDMLSAGISLKATADTNQAGTLHATAANYTLASGDSVGLALTGTPTAVAGVAFTATFEKV